MNWKNQALTLHSDALPENTLLVTKLSGSERLSGLFRFELELLCQDTELDLEAVLYSPARLGIQVNVPMAGGGFAMTTRQIAGVFAELEEQEQGQGWVKYRAILVPKLWHLSRTYRSRIFQEKTIDELVKDVLEGDGLDPQVDFEFKLSRQGKEANSPERTIYPQREYIVQYEESDLDFVARWLEHEGIYFYFVNNEDDDNGAEKILFGDTTSSYGSSNFASNFLYRPESAGKGAESDQFGAEEIYSFRCRQTRLPAHVRVSDYNWRTPSVDLKASTELRKDGTGDQTQYNDHFKTKAQGDALAKVRAEELACRARWFHGESSCRTFRPGTTFTLEEHFRADFNDTYLLVSVQHEAEQMISLDSMTVTGVKYHNRFEAIPASQPFRPLRTTDWPSIKGVMHGKIDAEGDGKYAEIDEHGRYKVTIPFDENAADAEPGKASRWIRMAQPYAGQNSGMHFPLLKGAEVLITHIDGDPDRPIIAAAVPNTETESPATGANRTQNALRTASGNVLHIDDNEFSSGFYTRDARGSQVIDRRWRSKDGGPTENTVAAAQAAGTGGAIPSPKQPTNTARPPSTTVPGTPVPGEEPGAGSGMPEIVSTIWDTGLENADDTVIPAWKSFFGHNLSGANTAFDAVSGKGRYTDQQAAGKESPLGLSVGEGLLPTNQSLTEGNLVTLLNHILKQHPRYGEWSATPGIAGTALSGAMAGLAKVTQNFEGTIAGSQIAVSLGDEVTMKVGDSFEYTDGSYDIKIGTGGYGREEVRGEGTTDKYTHAKATENSWNYGDEEKREWHEGNETSNEFHWGSTLVGFKIFGGAVTETETKMGAFNANALSLDVNNENSVFIGLEGKIDLMLAGKAELEIGAGALLKIQICAAASLEIEISAKAEFKTQNFKAILSADEVALSELSANLKKVDANIMKDAVGIQKTDTAISQMKTAINQNNTALQNSINALSKSVMTVKKDEVAAMASAMSATRTLTSGITMIQ
jgi:type VI secretion system VgrG family protein